jgi:hypothetical protein
MSSRAANSSAGDRQLGLPSQREIRATVLGRHGPAPSRPGGAATDRGIRWDRPLAFFPVKTNWYERASLGLIKASCDELARVLEFFGVEDAVADVAIPEVGCDFGEQPEKR